MNSISEVLPVRRPAAKLAISPRIFSLCYLAAITLATIGWLSAFGWITFSIARWLLA